LSGPAPRECVALQSAGPWLLLTWPWRRPGDARHHRTTLPRVSL